MNTLKPVCPRVVSAFVALLVALLMVATTPIASAAFLIEYQAPADPTTAGFSTIFVGPAPLVNEPIQNDLGHPAWSISGLDLSSQFVYISGALSAEQKADLANEGFTLTLRGRVLQGTAPAYDAGSNTVIGGAVLDIVSMRYDLVLGINSSGNAVAVLITSNDALGPGGSIRGFGPSYTLNDAGYHTYELVFNPQTQSASLFVDGTERISGYTGHTTQFLFDRGLEFGVLSGGGMNFNFVQLTSPMVSPVPDANIIDATHGFGAGSFELGTFVNGGGFPFGGPDFMGVAPGDGTTITGWTVGGPGDGVNWLTLPTYGVDSGIYAVDLQHLSSSSIATSIPTVAGNVYELSFSAAAVSGYSNTGTVSAGSLVNQPFTAPFSNAVSTQIYTPFTFLFTATGPTTTIEFAATGPNTAYGPVVDSVSVIGIEFFGDTLRTSESYGFSLEQYAQETESIKLVNTDNVSRSATLEFVNPHPELAIYLQSPNPISIAPGETADVSLLIDTASVPVGVYEGILLEVAVDDGSTLYSNIRVYVTEPGAAELPDLTISSEDIGFTSGNPGEPVTLTATIRNRGNSSASNVQVEFYEFDTFLGATVIDEIPGNGAGNTSITVPAMSSGDHLIRVVIDPSETIPELDETNNEASQIIQPGDTPGPTEGNILVTGSLPSTVYTNSLFSLTGRAVYDITVDGIRYTNYVVKGGSVEITIKGDNGTEWLYGGVHTNVNGNFTKSLLAPASPGTYRIIMTVTDKTFIGTRELVFTVVERPSVPPPPPLPPTTTGTGEWTYDPPSGIWTWTWTELPVNGPVPQSDVRVFSENIFFSENNPAGGEEITVFSEILYWASSTTLVAEDIPVNVYVTYPGTPKELIGQTVIPSMSIGAPENGSRFVYATWKNPGDGIYIVEVEIDPSYVEENMLDNAATRAIIVGALAYNHGVISGQVTDAWGGVDNVTIELYDSTGANFIENEPTDATGYYLFENVPVGDYQVHIFKPEGYQVVVAETKPAEVTDQSITEINFQLTKQGPPIADAGDDQTVNEEELVILDGSGSSDPDNDPLTYQWKHIAGPLVVLDLSDPVHPTFDAPEVQAGGATITFEFTVNDGELNSDPDLVDVTVKNVNNPPIADAGDDQTVQENSSVNLDGSGSYDLDGEALTYSWVQTAGSTVSLSDSTAVNPSFTAPFVSSTGETLIFELTVSDGIDIATDDVIVIVENVNHSPIADAGDDQTVNEGSLVTLDGSGSGDPDNDPLSHQWNQTAGPSVSLDLNNPVQPTFDAPEVQAGGVTITFELMVYDGELSSDPDQVNITVLDINDPPACDLAYVSSDSLWPPNHKFVLEEIVGVTDPNNENIDITVNSVTQDEPVNGLGDGDTRPDAVIQDSNVLLRAERSGNGNGRVYHVNFTANDGAGGICTGTVTVCVPHDRRDTGCIDDGQIHDSLQP